MDAITLLKADHKAVEGLFRRFERAGERATKSKRQIVDRIVSELSTHAAIEEQAFYPAVREALPELDEDVLEGLEEHHVVKWTLSELDGMDPDAERFEAKVTVLMESVRRHVREEEGELFPRVRQALGRKELREMGTALDRAKKMAPRRPHPRAPDTPPANVVAAGIAGVADRMREAGRDAARRIGS
jgi:hemerythrin superfamily protein